MAEINLLDHPLVRKYFACEDQSWPHLCGFCCDFLIAKRVLAAMQQPIKKGERYLYWKTDNTWSEHFRASDSAEFENGYHPIFVRLPDQFQPRQACRMCEEAPAIYKKPPFYCMSCQTDMYCSDHHSCKHASGKVEAKIREILEFIRKGERGGEYMRLELRELVDFVRKEARND